VVVERIPEDKRRDIVGHVGCIWVGGCV